MKKKGLVIIYDPHALMQFLQFYCMNDHSEIEWDVLCLPKDDGEQEMDGFCEKTGIFKNIYKNDTEFKRISIAKKIGLFVPMFFYALFGKQKKMCIKIFNSMVDDISAYDYYAANTESGFMAGLMSSFAKEKHTVYFEDGSADYNIERKKNQSIFNKWSFMNFQCVLMAKLGYFGKGYVYFEPTKYCYKYASIPEELAYKNYKEIYKFELNDEENEKYKDLLKKVYPELEQYEIINKGSCLAFTIPITADNNFGEDYIIKYQDYINNHAKEVYLKKHPRDNHIYEFSDNIVFHEIPQDIPAEMIFPYFNGCECYMMEPDSLLINMSSFDLFINVLYYKTYTDEENKLFAFSFTREFEEEYCKRFIGDKFQIIELQ